MEDIELFTKIDNKVKNKRRRGQDKGETRKKIIDFFDQEEREKLLEGKLASASAD